MVNYWDSVLNVIMVWLQRDATDGSSSIRAVEVYLGCTLQYVTVS